MLKDCRHHADQQLLGFDVGHDTKAFPYLPELLYGMNEIEIKSYMCHVSQFNRLSVKHSFVYVSIHDVLDTILYS